MDLHLGILSKNLMSSVACALGKQQMESGHGSHSHRVTRQLAVGGTRKGRGAAERELQEDVLSWIWKASKDLMGTVGPSCWDLCPLETGSEEPCTWYLGKP